MDWDFSVSSKHKLLDFKLRELIRYRDLIIMFFWRDFVTIYKQTILGPLWHIISPLCTTFVFMFTFGSIAGIGTDGIPSILFYYGGTMLWTYFSTCLTTASGIFMNNAGVFGKVFFPRLSVPIATTFSTLFKTLIQFIILMCFLVYYIATGSPVRPTYSAFMFPLMLMWLGALGTCLGMVFSAITAKYRDLSHVLNLIIQLTMFITPVAYPMSEVPQDLRIYFYFNPVSAPMELFRVWFYGVGNVPNDMIISSLGITMLVIILGLILFHKTERTFMDVI